MTIPRLFALVVALDLAGLAVRVASGAEPLREAVLIGTPLNAPLPFVLAQGLAVAAASRHRAGAAVLVLLCAVSAISGVADGSYAAALTAGERALQVALIAFTLALLAVAAARAVRPRPAPAAIG